MFMKYKRISTKDYLVNENQFIELLENKALEGWYLKKEHHKESIIKYIINK